jgi:hypothetical protein
MSLLPWRATCGFPRRVRLILLADGRADSRLPLGYLGIGSGAGTALAAAALRALDAMTEHARHWFLRHLVRGG